MEEVVEEYIKINYPRILKGHDSIICSVLSIISEINESHYPLIQNNDARFTIYSKFLTTLTASKINTFLLLDFINQKNWWEKYSGKCIVYDEEGGVDYIRETDLHNRWSLFIGFYSIFEHGIKILQIHSGNRSNVISYIIKDLELVQYSDVLNFARLTRNSIHNNGVHFPEKSKDDVLNYSLFGKVFHFSKFQRVDFSWEDCFFTIGAMIQISKEIYLNTKLVPSHICVNDIH